MQKHDNELQNILIQHEQCIHDVELKLKEMYTIHNKLKNIMTKKYSNEENDEIGSDESDDSDSVSSEYWDDDSDYNSFPNSISISENLQHVLGITDSSMSKSRNIQNDSPWIPPSKPGLNNSNPLIYPKEFK